MFGALQEWFCVYFASSASTSVYYFLQCLSTILWECVWTWASGISCRWSKQSCLRFYSNVKGPISFCSCFLWHFIFTFLKSEVSQSLWQKISCFILIFFNHEIKSLVWEKSAKYDSHRWCFRKLTRLPPIAAKDDSIFAFLCRQFL